MPQSIGDTNVHHQVLARLDSFIAAQYGSSPLATVAVIALSSAICCLVGSAIRRE
jgi:hypothetical protein